MFIHMIDLIFAFVIKKNNNKYIMPKKNDVSPDDDTLVLAVDHHVPVHVVCQGVDVRGVLILSLQNRQYSN